MHNSFDELVWKCYKSFAVQKNPMSLNMLRLFINARYIEKEYDFKQETQEELNF